MTQRFWFPLICLFWVAMNWWLWRAEFGGGREAGSAVPLSTVWQKILTAPDSSTMEASLHGKRIGYCRWSPNVAEAPAAKAVPAEAPLEGAVARLTGYTIDLEANLLLESTNRLRVSLHLEFSTNHHWLAMDLRANTRTASWEAHAHAASQTLRLKLGDQTSGWERTLTPADWQNPAGLFEELGVPWAAGLLTGLAPSRPRGLALGLAWRARNDWLRIGHSQARVYRLEARLFDRYRAMVIVSRAGEILRVQLPEDLRLDNEAMLSW